MGKNQHVVPHAQGWAVKSAGAGRAASVHARQSDAIDAARAAAKTQHSELLVHGRDGQIRAKDSYGSDRFPPKG
jgi:Uncharacterized protein conserved in bacteria (DUF2188)